MAVSIREYCEDDRAQAGMIWSAAFDGGQPNPRLDNPELPLDLRSPDEDSQVFVADVDGVVSGAFQIFYAPITCRGAHFRCGGMSGVAVAPASRKRHVGSAMMTWAIEQMHRTGEVVTNLRAAHEFFYRRFGWECLRTLCTYYLSCPTVSADGL